MSWGSSGGGGVGTQGASPEAARGADALRERGDGPRDDDPPPRPGCRGSLLLLVGVLIALVILFWLGGSVLHLFG
jgi:hypothetical protein